MICENCAPILEGPQALNHEACGSWVLSLEEDAVVNSSWEGRVLMLDKSVSMLPLDETKVFSNGVVGVARFI